MASESGDEVEKVVISMNKVAIEGDGAEGDRQGASVVVDNLKEENERHCAFCLTLTTGETVIICGGCKRRAYCSKECQKADWKFGSDDGPVYTGKIHGYGQGHKNWCHVPCGEEDLDWKVVPIEGKGLGVVALRDFPPLYRIMVEGLQLLPDGPNDPIHPSIMDLTPNNSTNIAAKWKNNMGFGWKPGSMGIGLRVSRLNHACQSNSAVMAVEQFEVAILFAEKEIKAGDEITCSYLSYTDMNLLKKWTRQSQQYLCPLPKIYHAALKQAWGIVCSPSCFCRQVEFGQTICPLLKQCVEWKKGSEEQEELEKLPKMEKIVQAYKTLIEAPPSVMQQIYFWAGQSAELDLKFGCGVKGAGKGKIDGLRAKCTFYLEKRMEINSKIWHPTDDGFLIFLRDRASFKPQVDGVGGKGHGHGQGGLVYTDMCGSPPKGVGVAGQGQGHKGNPTKGHGIPSNKAGGGHGHKGGSNKGHHKKN